MQTFSLESQAVQQDAQQHTATHCNKLQHTTTHCNTLASRVSPWRAGGVQTFSLESRSEQCAALQHTATHRNTLQHTAAHSQVGILRGEPGGADILLGEAGRATSRATRASPLAPPSSECGVSGEGSTAPFSSGSELETAVVRVSGSVVGRGVVTVVG